MKEIEEVDRKFKQACYSVANKITMKKPIVAVLTIAFLLLALLPAKAQLRPNTNPPVAVTLAWDANQFDTVGYKVYWGDAPRFYTFVADAGPATSFQVTNLSVGRTYYFAATAYNAVGIESDFSSEVAWTAPSAPAPPGGVRTGDVRLITTFIQRAPSLEGPWEDISAFVTTLHKGTQVTLVRSRIEDSASP